MREIVSAFRPSRFEIAVEDTDRIAANHILWSRDGVRGNRHTADQSFERNDAEGIGHNLRTRQIEREKCCEVF